MASRGVEQGEEWLIPILYLYVQAYATVFLVLVFGKGERANISQADTNALGKRAGGLKAWAKERHEEWLRQIQRH